METVKIDGRLYVAASTVADTVGVCRQTLWRWRQSGRVPSGHRHRNGQVLFTEEEAEEVYRYAYRVDPIAPPERLAQESGGAGASGE